MFKLGFNIHDGHISQGAASHAEQIRTAREYDDTVRAVVFPETKSIYFRFFCPSWDGLSRPTAEQTDESFRQCVRALERFIRAHLVKKSWKVLYWATDETHVKALDVRF